MISFWVFKLLFFENSVMFLECLKNNSKILSDVIIMQFGKGVLPDRVRDMTWWTGTRKISNIGCE